MSDRALEQILSATVDSPFLPTIADTNWEIVGQS